MARRKDGIHITSHKQSGAITAGEVNVTGGSVSEKKGWRWTERWNWIAGIIATLVAVVGLFWSLKGGHIMKQSNQQKGNTNISSFNQSGGITAHTVNLGPTPRVISVERRQRFLESSRDAPKGDIILYFVADKTSPMVSPRRFIAYYVKLGITSLLTSILRCISERQLRECSLRFVIGTIPQISQKCCNIYWKK